MLHFDISKCAQSGMQLLAGGPGADPGMSAWIPVQIPYVSPSGVAQRSSEGQGEHWATVES